ncbi:MAG: glycosyltransferase family A protein, partial [Candidatus Sumerlaeota bacterium]|nr:glycosyltransferase family A protein [Candidatus Sumerlaeota bacterium]
MPSPVFDDALNSASHADLRPLVSVVLPVYNGEAFVERALRSFLAQTWRPMELLIVNDGSQDRTAEVLAPWIEKLNSDSSQRVAVRYFEQENQGQPAATNRAIEEARGEFVALLDADDEWLPEHVE